MPCPSDSNSGSTSSGVPWINWAVLAGGNVETFHVPATLADIVRIVQDAEAAGKHVRAVGSGWAFEDIAYSPEVMVSLDRLNSVLTYVTDFERGALLSQTISDDRTLVHVEAGIKVATLNFQLEARNLAMPTLGGSNGQSIAGALSTSTHGGDFEEPPFCDLIHAIHLVGPGGQEYWIERASAPITISARLGRVLPCPDTLIVRDDELFDAVAVGLGRFGIIYSVILEAVPAYTLARERTIRPLPFVVNWLGQGIDQGNFLEPLLMNLPPPSANLSTVSTRPRGLELTLDSRNPAAVHVVRRWLADGPDMNIGGGNPLCDLGSAGVLSIGAGFLSFFGMNPAFVGNPIVFADPTRLPRLTAKQLELISLIPNGLTPGQALAVVSNAYWDFDIIRVPDVLSLVGFQRQLEPQRGPSYAVMTGAPTYDADGNRLPHELHWCYNSNSCEIMFDAVNGQYLEFLLQLARNAPRFRQAGYISVRFSRRSRALLSMHNVESDHAVAVEVSTFKYMYDSDSWIEFALGEGQARGGRPHWGQQHHFTAAQTQGMYGERLDRWRAVLAGLSGDSTLFSSAFTTARGLEPQGAREIQIEGTASALASSPLSAISLLLLAGQP